MKAYTLGNNGFVTAHILSLLGVAPHVRQARVIIIAASRTIALDLYTTRRAGLPVTVRHLEQCHGDDLDALAAAGLTTQPGLYVVPLHPTATQPVITVGAEGTPTVAGHLHRDPDTGISAFTPKG